MSSYAGPLSQPLPPSRPPAADRLIALRGYSAVAPENTLAAVRAAVAASRPATVSVWADVRVTQDGVPVLLHDATLERTTSCTGEVVGKTAAELGACDAGSWFDTRFAGEKVPRLADALAVSGVVWYLELHVPAADKVMAVVRSAGAADRVTLVADGAEVADSLIQLAPEVPAWLHVEVLDGDAIQMALDKGAKGVAVDLVAEPLAAKDVAAAHLKGLSVAAFDVQDEQSLLALAAMKVDWQVVQRWEPASWALGYQYRTYGASNFGRNTAAGQGLGRALAVGQFDDGRDRPGVVPRDDLVIGAPNDSRVAANAGWVALALGGTEFPGRVLGDLGAAAGAGQERDGQWGSLFTVGDYDGDGYDDLAVGYPLRDFAGPDSGAIWLIDGSLDGQSGQSRPIGPAVEAGAHMGQALATGDFNGDGVADLAIGIPGQTVGGQAGAGQVIVLPGQKGAGPVAQGALVLDRSQPGVPGDPSTREAFGSSLAAGDFDGDGYDDLAIGVPGGDGTTVRDAGSVIIAYCNTYAITGGLHTTQIEELTRDTPDIPGDPARGGGFGGVLAAGDFDNDGFDDLAIGSPAARVEGASTAGDVVVTYGAFVGRDRLRTQLIDQTVPLIPGEPETRATFGAALAAGDLNGDGMADLVIGSPGTSGTSAGALPAVGAVTAVYGSLYGLNSRVALLIAPGMPPLGFEPTGRQAFGSALAVGDLNGDGAADLAIGAPGQTLGGVQETGALVVAWGYQPALPGVATATPRPPTATPPPTVTRTPRPTATFKPPTITPMPGPTRPVTPSPTPTRTPRGGGKRVYMPWSARLKSLGYYATPVRP